MLLILATGFAGVILTVAICFIVFCWSRCCPRKPVIGPVLPIGDEESDADAWQRVSFKRETSTLERLTPSSHLGFHTDPTPAGYRRVSAISMELVRDTSNYVSEETHEYNDRTLDVLLDKKLGRQSLQI